MLRALFFSLTTLALPFFTHATIIETRYLADALDHIDKDTWFLVDLDNTLFEAKQALGHVHWIYDEIQQRMDQGMSREDALKEVYPLWEQVQSSCSVKPIETAFIPSLLELQQHNIVVMGLTHRHATVERPTLTQIHSLNFDFTHTAPSKDNFPIPASHPALYSNGVLFCSDFNLKSDIFFTFTNLIQQRPQKVVFIDDRKKNVEEVVENLSRAGIACTGIYYTAIDHTEPVYSREIAQFQLNCFNRILSNEEAFLLMEREVKQDGEN